MNHVGEFNREKRLAAWVAGVLVALGIGSLFLIVVAPNAGAAHASAPSRCKVSQLSVHLGQSSGAAGSVGQSVHFTNSSSTSCTLSGYPGMLMLNAAGRPLATHVRRGASATVPQIPLHLVTVLPGGRASFDLGYAAQTGYGNLHCPTSSTVEITPPNAFSHFTIAWKLQPYGGTVQHLRCGVINVSPVYAG